MVTSYLSMTSLDSCLQDDVAVVTFWFDCKANFLFVFVHSAVCTFFLNMLNYSLSTLQHLVLTTCVWIKATSHSAVPRNTFSQALVKGGFCFSCLTTILLVFIELKGGMVRKLKSAIYIKIEKRTWEQLYSYIEQYWNIDILLLKVKLVRLKLCLNIQMSSAELHFGT